MQALVVFESVSDASRDVARAVGDGLFHVVDIDVDVVEATAAAAHVGELDLLVVGASASPADDDAAPSSAVREWLRRLDRPVPGTPAAAFDLRPRGEGRPSAGRAVEQRLVRLGFHPVASAESFGVAQGTGPLLRGEAERAKAWGEELGRTVAAAHVPRRRSAV